ncbi:MAG: hypothetical protein VYC17_03075 [Nitrospinota bacterium]|nr:hypothetical protein [Nitrospinota bacterium]
MANQSKSIMIECRGCGIQNIFNLYTPEDFLICNQCRERLVEPDFCETYRQFDCQDCNFSLFILNETNFKPDEAACRCGGTNIQQQDSRPFLQAVKDSGGLDIENQSFERNSDWYRSEPVSESDYDEMFDRDPGDDEV